MSQGNPFGAVQAGCHAVTVTVPAPTALTIPRELLPVDGRFGCGPSKVRPEQLEALLAAGTTVIGTSHRQAPVKRVVGAVRAGLTELFGLPDGWEIVLGNGGTTVFWDVASFGLVEQRSQHLVFGEFSSKFAEVCTSAPHLGDPVVVSSEPGTHPTATAQDGIDLYALTHNETSTGVAMDLRRPAGTDGALVAVDATSGRRRAALGPRRGRRLLLRPAEVLRRRRRAVDRRVLAGRRRAHRAARRVGPLAPGLARPRHRPDQQPPRPDVQHAGRRDAAAARVAAALDARVRRPRLVREAQPGLVGPPLRLGRVAPWATPFVADPAQRSAVVGTIDLDAAVEATKVSAALRANGVVDTDSYRKLGRNQLRIGMFPAIEPADVEALTACIDFLVEHHGESLAP